MTESVSRRFERYTTLHIGRNAIGVTTRGICFFVKGVQELGSILIPKFFEKIANFVKSTDITAKSAISRRFERYTTCYV